MSVRSELLPLCQILNGTDRQSSKPHVVSHMNVSVSTIANDVWIRHTISVILEYPGVSYSPGNNWFYNNTSVLTST